MATITTTGSVTGLLAVDPGIFDAAAESVATKTVDTFSQAASDLEFGNYYFDTVSSSVIELYLNGAAGWMQLQGSGFTSSSPRITQIVYDGDDGYDLSLSGSINESLGGRITALSTSWAGDQLTYSGSLSLDGAYNVVGNIKAASIATQGYTLTYSGNLASMASGDSGTYKSISLSDGSGNAITVSGSIAYATWESESQSAATVDDLFDSSTLLAGNDIFNVADAAHAWHGYGGNDKLTGGAQADALYGDDGNDKLYGLDGWDVLSGGLGNDRIEGGAGGDLLIGDDGSDPSAANNDQLYGGDGADWLWGGYGVDKLDGGSGDDDLHGGDGNDKLTGGDGNDLLDGGSGIDALAGGWGDDVYLVDNAADKVKEAAGQGTDSVTASVSYSIEKAGEVEILELDATAGDISGTGNKLNNALYGNDGNNILNGKLGADTVTGGDGNDIIVFDHLTVGVYDTVTDFEANSIAEDDTLQLSAKVFKSLAAGVAEDNLAHGTAALDVDDFLIFDDGSGSLYYDADGSGTKFAAVQFAQINIGTLLDANDFTVV